MNRITKLFNIKFPIIQAGMVWCSGWRLASAVSNAGGLGLIGAGSMHPELLEEHIIKCKAATNLPFGINVPLLYPEIDRIMDIIVKNDIKIVFTSAGNPKNWTGFLKKKGITVVHVVSSVKFALKSQEAGVDAVVAEGFEAGGHNGREEITTFCLIPATVDALSIPVIAAGGIGSGRGILGALALGAEGVQIGSRFAISEESSAHINFKNRIVESNEGDTSLSLKQLNPVRLLKNEFYNQITEAENNGAGIDELKSILGKRRSKTGIFEGDLVEGELEIGQISAYIKEVKPAGRIVKELWSEYLELKDALCKS
jgi:enoyl-[acyl-carrier protein] reductase II